jgi:hypothetical protein
VAADNDHAMQNNAKTAASIVPLRRPKKIRVADEAPTGCQALSRKLVLFDRNWISWSWKLRGIFCKGFGPGSSIQRFVSIYARVIQAAEKKGQFFLIF